MKTILTTLVLSLSISSIGATTEEVFFWFKPLEGQEYTMSGAHGCERVSIENVMYDFGAGPNTPTIVIKSLELGKELHLAGGRYHRKYRTIEGDTYTFNFKQGCDGEFFNGMCKTSFELVKDGDMVTSLKLVNKRTRFGITVSKDVLECEL